LGIKVSLGSLYVDFMQVNWIGCFTVCGEIREFRTRLSSEEDLLYMQRTLIRRSTMQRKNDTIVMLHHDGRVIG
jgi:hypothetical protein